MTKEPERNPRKALGKGLSALLPARGNPSSSAEAPPALSKGVPLPDKFDEFRTIPLSQITPSQEQPRGSFDTEKLEELARSIQANGLLQPITVYRKSENEYVLIAGERRWRAAQIAGLDGIPALVRTAEQQERLELALIENIQREDLNPIEVARAFQNLAEEHGLSHEEIAIRTGKERSTVTNFLRLLKLSTPLQTAITNGSLTMGHARALLNLDDSLQLHFYRRIQNEGLSVRDTERLVRDLSGEKPAAPKGQKPSLTEHPSVDPNIRAAIDELARTLGTRVRLLPKENGSGRIEIEYYSQDDLDRIYSALTSK